ncbi:MAG TPA: isoleucine--tRNA ligase [Fibrobacteria bacterium]|nr:isoleucine--tRNA ligase [Fibrobacteria bacterium]
MLQFREPEKNVSFPEIERRILAFWDDTKAFEGQEAVRRDAPAFHFYDGPPFATGLPHYGHLLAGTLKDIVPRYWSMRGHRVDRRFGWDVHGVPVETEIQNNLNLAGLAEIKAYGIDRFNEACRSIVLRYTGEWEKTVRRMGRWVHFKGGYRTMDPSFMESVWWVFKECFDKGLIYEGYRVVPYSPKLATPLSNFEVNQGYRDRQDPSLTLKFFLEGDPDEAAFLVWTTTPWTLPSNLAVALGPEIEYVKIRHASGVYWIAEPRLAAYFDAANVEVLERRKGAELAGRAYRPLFTCAPRLSERQYTLVLADFVSTEDGAGAVHIAPSFGEEDFQLGQTLGLGLWDPLDADGRFTDLVPEWKGREAKDADKDIVAALKDRGLVFLHETLVHSYPHCYRTGVPLLYRAMRTWFLGVDRPVTNGEGVTKSLKQWMIESNQQITWVPSHIKDGRFGKWLDGARDWNLSRNRFWGTPIPVWKSGEGKLLCIGSVAELARLSGRDPATISDLHTHFIDSIEIRTSDGTAFDPEGEVYRRTSEVLDCWFESGSMPYAQMHYPFENARGFPDLFPADFIAEGLDQTRGWFYTLTVLGAALFQGPAFLNVVVNGIILAEDGQKMSKRLKNYPDPNEVLESIGADPLRMYLIDSAAVKGEELRFSEAGVREVVRSVLLPLWHSVSLFCTYHNADRSKGQLTWTPGQELSALPLSDLDRWILAELQDLLAAVEREMEGFRLYNVVPEVVRFVDSLTNWYIRRSRRRFWKSDDDGDKSAAYATLHRVLVDFAKVLAPYLPFLAEEIWQILAAEVDPSLPRSVHHCDMPRPDESLRDPVGTRRVKLARIAVEHGRSLRSKHDLKVRQPLASLTVVPRSDEAERDLLAMREVILEELNVKELRIERDETHLVTLSVRPNFKTLGKRLGSSLRTVGEGLKALDAETLRRAATGETISVAGHDLGPDDLLIDRTTRGDLVVEAAEDLTVALDPVLTPELRREGLARELQSRLQAHRKDLDLAVTDRILVKVLCASDDLAAVVEAHGPAIALEVQADSLEFVRTAATGIRIDGIDLDLAVVKV